MTSMDLQICRFGLYDDDDDGRRSCGPWGSAVAVGEDLVERIEVVVRFLSLIDRLLKWIQLSERGSSGLLRIRISRSRFNRFSKSRFNSALLCRAHHRIASTRGKVPRCLVSCIIKINWRTQEDPQKMVIHFFPQISVRGNDPIHMF